MTDHEITLDQILSFDQSRELFRDFMSKEKSLGKIKPVVIIYIISFRGPGFLPERKRVRKWLPRASEKRARGASEKDLQATRSYRLF